MQRTLLLILLFLEQKKNRIIMKVKATAVVVELSFEKDFLTFLDQNNALEQFCTRFCNNGNLKILVRLISSTPLIWISYAFTWDDLKFWKNLSDKWEETISQPGISPNNVIFEVLDKDKSQEIWDKLQTYSGSLQGKYYKVADNSWNRSADQAIDSQEVWDEDDNSWKDLIGKAYLILSEKPVIKKIKSWYCGGISRRFIKIWIPEQECVQWVLYQRCSYVKPEKD